MTLIETFPGETEADFRHGMDEILQGIIPSNPAWWYPYEVRGVYECRGVRFRHFWCQAGSVECWLWLHASVGWPRRMIVIADVNGGPEPAKMIGRGEEILVDADEIQEVK